MVPSTLYNPQYYQKPYYVNPIYPTTQQSFIPYGPPNYIPIPYQYGVHQPNIQYLPVYIPQVQTNKIPTYFPYNIFESQSIDENIVYKKPQTTHYSSGSQGYESQDSKENFFYEQTPAFVIDKQLYADQGFIKRDVEDNKLLYEVDESYFIRDEKMEAFNFVEDTKFSFDNSPIYIGSYDLYLNGDQYVLYDSVEGTGKVIFN